ncbi:hypothetical protein TRICI_000779 [Trichomonascus ciferrii]|uniref:RRM domain-containing protein n=1 Tax=Trichomonascus ciferrii TaxID=44093 RepID=A0A642VBQ8_9ASCO|nr:hypothetical protein TRICI_000779 [Trichomonascus ciferrii]
MDSNITRLHLGNISPNVDVETLTKRLSKFGEVTEPLEVHHKPTLDTWFGYISMKLSQQQLAKLKTAYHGVMFKGTRMTINPAKPKYTEWLKQDQVRSDPGLSRDQLKRLYSRSQRGIDEIPGRMRKAPRKNLRKMTFRFTKKNGRKVLVTCSKKKLWGYKKDRTPDQLVWEYVNGQWRDGNGDVLETVDFQKLLQQDDQGTGEDGAELDRNMQILNDLFKDGNDSFRRVEIFDEDDEDNPIPPSERKSKHQVEEEEPNNDLHDLFGIESQPTEGFSLKMQLDDDDINMDNAFEDEPEILPVTSTMATTTTTNDTNDIRPMISDAVKPRGLFFSHRDSPFLSTQSRLASIPSADNFNPEAWAEDFWKRRSELSRQFQRRRRDVLRRRKTKHEAFI